MGPLEREVEVGRGLNKSEGCVLTVIILTDSAVYGNAVDKKARMGDL